MKKTLIIAEAGVNHNGSLELAKKLIDVAANAEVDFVKFQTFKAEKLVSKAAKMAEYQVENIGKAGGQYEMIKKLELDEEAHHKLISYCKDKGVKFLSTAFDLESVDLLKNLGITLFKIPSGEITNLPYLEKIAQTDFPIILSTGMSKIGEIEDALHVLRENGVEHDKITVLHCNTQYPTPMHDVNLNAMNTIKKAFDVNVGYSDHTLGIEVPIAAVALGATCIEKHFTLDRNMEGPDHKASLEPKELKAMVKGIRNIELALGSSVKRPTASEIKNIPIARKSIHVNRNLISGDILKESDLIMKRPGDGISPMEVRKIIGRTISKPILEGKKLEYKDFI